MPAPYRQSDGEAVYAAALRRLAGDALVYPCDCSRKDISAASDVPDEQSPYSGRCRDRGLESGEGQGVDLLGSTGRQIRLARMLGRAEPPAFFHHPLIRNDSGVKLSKANGETGIRELRAAGIKPGAVLGLAAHLTGLLDRPRELRSDQLAELFD